VIKVPGYTYGQPPADFKQTVEAMDATGMFTATVARSVTDTSGTEVAAIVLFQYNPKPTVFLDKKGTSRVLSDAVAGMNGQYAGKTTVTSHVLFGSQVRLLHGKEVSIAVTYKRGGQMTQVFGQAPAPVLKFTTAYLTASR